MYRAVTLYALNSDSKLDASNIKNITIDFGENGEVFLNEKIVTNEIRSSLVTNNVSKFASLDFVREYLVKLQQKIANNKGMVMDGRNIGTVVILDIYL